MSEELSRSAVLLADLESSYGAGATLTAADDAFEIVEVTRPKLIHVPIQRNLLRASLSPRPIKKTQKLWEISFTVEAKNGGTAGTVARIGRLLKACGMTQTVNAGTDVRYKPGQEGDSLRIEFYNGKTKWTIDGARGDVVDFKVDNGAIPLITFKFQGIYTKPTAASLPTATYETTEGQLAESTSTTIQGYSGGVIRSYSFQLGNQIVTRPDLNSAGAMKGVRIGSRTPKGKLLMEFEDIATEDFFTNLDDDSTVTFNSQIGATAGNIWRTEATVQYEDLDNPDENGILMMDWSLSPSGTDNEITFILK